MDSNFIAIATLDELKPGQMKRVEAGGRKLILANSDDRYYVVDEMCSHEDYSLYLGCIQDGKIKCSLHGSYFDLETGQATVDPAHEPIGVYPVEINDNQIWVDPT